jgi:cysteine desulfuration protein SufE
MRRGSFGGLTETGLSDAIGCQKARAYARIASLISRPFVTISPPSTIGRVAIDMSSYSVKPSSPLSEAAHNGANKVRGGVSEAWQELGNGANATGERVLHYRGDSDSHLVRGLIAIALALYSDHTVREILSSDAQAFFRELGLEQHLTPQRFNGVRAMIERICADAALWVGRFPQERFGKS